MHSIFLLSVSGNAFRTFWIVVESIDSDAGDQHMTRKNPFVLCAAMFCLFHIERYQFFLVQTQEEARFDSSLY